MKEQSRKSRIITIVLSVLFLLLPAFLGSIFDASLYKNSTYMIRNGVMDFHNRDINQKTNGIYVTGSMDFYYNKWIVTDKEEEATPDGMISLPDFWTSVKVDGKNLPTSGYASYRFKIINVPVGIKITADSDYSYSSSRIFFDDVLVGQNGEPSKIKEEDKIENRFTRKADFKVTKSEVTVTIEVGNSHHAGIIKGPMIISSQIKTTSQRGKQLLLFCILGVMIGCIFLLTITGIMRSGFLKTLPPSLAALCLLCYWLFSGDGLVIMKLINIPNTSYTLYKSISIVFLGLFMIACPLCVILNRKMPQSKLLIATYSILGISTIISRLSLIYHTTFLIPFIICIIFYSVLTFYQISSSNTNTIENLYIILFFSLLGNIVLATLDDANMFSFQIAYMISYTIFIGSLLCYFVFFIRTMYLKTKTEEEKKIMSEQTYLKTIALQEQVNPNVIFNALSIIEDTYHRDISKGDYALSSFSNVLRYNITSMDRMLVTFSDEIDGLISFNDFQSTRENKGIPLVLNIEAYEFMIPPLTILTIIGKFYMQNITDINEEKNMMEVSSIENKKEFVVQLIDHRHSHTIDERDEEIRNIKERLQLTIKGKLSVRNDDDETTVEIIIPKK